MKTRFIVTGFIIAFTMIVGIETSNAQGAATETLILERGWNIISTPKVLESHSFSASETSENFDIYLLNPSSPSGWSTMADLGQTEFKPLFGYFINNKTEERQTLTFTYDITLEPHQKLFERTFTNIGWYSIGVANGTYAKSLDADRTDLNNPSNVLSLLEGDYDSVIDFTDAKYGVNRKSLALSDPWRLSVASDVNQLNDLREGKGYAIYIKDPSARYSGFQNDAVIGDSSPASEIIFSISDNNPDATDIIVDKDSTTDDVTILEYSIKVDEGSTELHSLFVNFVTSDDYTDVVDDVSIIVDGLEFDGEAPVTGNGSTTVEFILDSEVLVGDEGVLAVVLVDFKAQDGNYDNGTTIKASVRSAEVEATQAEDITEFSGTAIGNAHMLTGPGIIVPADGVATEADSVGANDQIGQFTIEFEVTAVEGDFYITDNAVQASTSPIDGIAYTVTGGNGLIVAALSSTADEDTPGVFTINEGETETLTLTVTIDPVAAGSFRVQLEEVWYSENSNGEDGDAYIPTPAQDFRTPYQSINAN